MEKHEEIYEESELYRIRHSAAHVMAEAVLEKFPEAKIAIGPPIEDGFYYDFDLPRTLTPEDLEEIEAKMVEIIAQKEPFEKEVLSAEQAKELFKDQPYKIELIEGLEQGGVDEYGEPITEKPEISIYKSGNFVDLCRGPHVEHTGLINRSAVKLMNSAGAYWRGDENKPMLQRIYGTAWKNPKQLKLYLKRLEEAKKRDHRKLGKELDLFSANDEVGPGLILWHPKGGMIRHLAEDYWKKEHIKSGYDIVFSPHIGRSKLWETSGHLGFFDENMYSPVDVEGQQYYLKPMNCPFHIHMYKSRGRSYREFPLRFAELGTVYRYERSGVLHGLLRVRGFTQDDAHHFCAPEQMPAEIDFVLDFSLRMLRAFGFSQIEAYLSTKPDKATGDPQRWEDAEAALKDSLERANQPYKIDEGGGAFYGPKIDLKVRDAINREWQLSTIQFDFNLPDRFEMLYTDSDGQQKQPYMIHRALLGSMERFFGVLIEHFAGAFPVWLAPIQASIIPIADRHLDYAYDINKKLKANNIRVEVDDRSERMNAKIRDAQNQKIPYMLIIGDKEVESQQISLRMRNGENPGGMSLDDFLAVVEKDIEERN